MQLWGNMAVSRLQWFNEQNSIPVFSLFISLTEEVYHHRRRRRHPQIFSPGWVIL
jgi:hypothetical protein